MTLTPVVSRWAFDPALLGRRMCFISGPRQVGKTTLVQLFLKRLKQEQNYYNWDTLDVKRRFIENPLFFLENIPEPVPSMAKRKGIKHWVVFDEFHKHPRWKDTLKGLFDEFGSSIRFIVCGSARLDLFRKSGESLLGRYFHFRMFPLGPKDVAEGEKFHVTRSWNPSESIISDQPPKKFKQAVDDLYRLTGFPEPFLTGREDFYRRWRDEHLSILATEEVRDLSKISDLMRLQYLTFLLPEKVGSILSLNNLAQSLSCAHSTVNTWLDALEQVYMIFRLPPYMGKLSRTIRKEKKAYFWDWGVIEDKGKRFENFLAVQLMRTVSAWTEWGWGAFNLFYVRTKDGKETDFLITKDRKPLILVEAKLSGAGLDSSLLFFKERLSVPLAFQVIWDEDYLRQLRPGLFVIDIFRLLKLLV